MNSDYGFNSIKNLIYLFLYIQKNKADPISSDFVDKSPSGYIIVSN